MGDPKRDNGPTRPRPGMKDVPSRPPDPSLAADLLADLKATEPDFEITEFVPPMDPSDRSSALPLPPASFELAREPVTDESTLRIDLAPPPSFPPAAATLVDPRPRPRSPVPKAAPKLTLPCNVLVVDDDRRAGAQTGARLMEVGCTCRSVSLEEAAEVLDRSVHVVLLDIPAAEVRSDGGRARIARLAPWRGPLVVTSAAVIDPLPELAGAAVIKPYFIEDLIGAIQEARRKLPPARDPSRSVEILDPVEAIAHHDLDANVVRAMLVRADGQVSRGRVRTMSYDGELLVAMNQPPRGIDVSVELTLADGRRTEIPGKVVQASTTEMEVALKLGDQERLFLRHFLDQARDITQPFVEQVRIRQLQPLATAVVDESQLDRLWNQALAKLDDDDLQQRFIQACLKAQKLEHAVRCYRDLKQERPDDERVAKYLQQVGTILGFYAFRKEPALTAEAKLPTGIKVAMALFVVAALILGIMVLVMR